MLQVSLITYFNVEVRLRDSVQALRFVDSNVEITIRYSLQGFLFQRFLYFNVGPRGAGRPASLRKNKYSQFKPK